MSPHALSLAKAISNHESSGCKNTKGASGETGCFQFMPSTWQAVSIEMTGSVLTQLPNNEKYVASLKIQSLLDKGRTPRDIALIWNGSLAGSEKPIEKKGRNKKGILYNTTAYAEAVTSLINQ